MERIAQAHQRIRPQFVGQQAGHAPPHGLATDGQRARDLLPHLGMHRAPSGQQTRLRIRRATLAVQAPRGHVGKFEAHHGNPARP